MTNKPILFVTVELLFTLFSTFIVFLFLTAIVFTELNIFSYITYFLILSVTFFLLYGFYYFKLKHKVIFNMDKRDLLAVGIVLLVCSLNVLFFHEGFAGGRDDGVYANAALYLAKHDSVYITDPNVVTFPGFIETSKGILSQFYIGYIAWTALTLTLFGVHGLAFVNFPLLFGGLLSVYFIAKYFENWRVGIVTITLISLSFPFLWFTRITFSENLAFMLTWFGLFCFINATKTKKFLYLILAILSINATLIVRAEAIPLVIISNIIMLIYLFKYGKRTAVPKLFFIIILTIMPALFYYLAFDPRYTEIIAKEITQLINPGANQPEPTTTVQQVSNIGQDILEYRQPQMVYYLLQMYNFIFLIVMVPLCLLKSFKLYPKTKRILLWLLFLMLVPNIIYFIKPSITFDQPWFLRRYMPIILPFSFMCFVFIVSTLNKKFQITMLSMIIISSFIITAPIFAFKQYDGVIDQVNASLDGQFTPQDLVVIDYDNIGHYKIAERLYFDNGIHTIAANNFTLNSLVDKNAKFESGLYIGQAFQFEPKNVCTYERIFIVTSQEEPNILTNFIASESASTVKYFNLHYDELLKTCEVFRLADKASLEQMANINYYDAVDYCKTIPNYIIQNDVKLELKQLNDNAVRDIKKLHC